MEHGFCALQQPRRPSSSGREDRGQQQPARAPGTGGQTSRSPAGLQGSGLGSSALLGDLRALAERKAAEARARSGAGMDATGDRRLQSPEVWFVRTLCPLVATSQLPDCRTDN